MTAPIWETPSGFLGTLTERVTTSIPLIATGTNLTYSLIAGNLPTGISLNSASGVLIGTPVSVPAEISSTFVIRAQNSDGISDRTFKLDVIGPSIPVWATTQGPLPVGQNGEAFTFNLEYIDITLRAQTDIIASGNSLKYYIADNQGQLPPGLTLTEEGRIYGYVKDNLTLDNLVSQSGGYDDEMYDAYPYDHSVIIDNVVQLVKPETINKIYQFIVTVTDGYESAQRLFSIEVVDPNSMRSDNTFIDVDNTTIDASSSYLLAPIWQSKLGNLLPNVANLGTVRAATNQVINLYDYDPYPFVGPVIWDWSITVNPDIRLISDSQINFLGHPTQNLAGNNQLYFKDASLFPVVGMQIQLNEYIPGYDSTTYTITNVFQTGSSSGYVNLDRPLVTNSITGNMPDSVGFYAGTPSIHPPALSLSTSSGVISGTIPYQPAYSQTYRFTVSLIKTDYQTGNTVRSSQIFLLTINGDIQSYIEFVSTSSLGTLLPGQISELAVVAKNVNTNFNLEYSLAAGELPAGLTLNSDGTIQGKIQYNSETTFDMGDLTLDQNSTTIDKNWYFSVSANDVYRLDSITQQFYITIAAQPSSAYTRMYVKPFMPVYNRTAYNAFISDPTIFDPTLLYRSNDPEFGTQPDIKMLIETGIEIESLDTYASALTSVFHRKRFYFGDIGSIAATDSNNNVVYELIYVSMIDDQMIGNYSPSYAVSLENMKIQLESIQISPGMTISIDDDYQPRYMTTLQSNGVPLGFIKIVPICYVIPGNSAKVLSRIASSGFDFKQLDFDTDRVIIETTQETGLTNWLLYPTARQ